MLFESFFEPTSLEHEKWLEVYEDNQTRENMQPPPSTQLHRRAARRAPQWQRDTANSTFRRLLLRTAAAAS